MVERVGENMYIPKPEDTTNVNISEEILNLTEIIAKNAHENWAKKKIDDGWTYGEELDDAACTHPCLVEYESLSEADKEYDRVTAMEAIKLLLKLGYKITK